MMVGDPVPIVAADSFVKGLTDFDAEGLYQNMKLSGESPTHRPGIAEFRRLGFVPMDPQHEHWGPVSMTLEYAVSDYAMARLAEGLGHAEDAVHYDRESLAYRNLFDVSTGTLRHASAKIIPRRSAPASVAATRSAALRLPQTFTTTLIQV